MESEHPAGRIKFVMRTCNVTVQQLALRAGIPLEALRDVLDERAVAPPSVLRRIAEALGSKDTFFAANSGSPEAGAAGDAARRSSGPGPVRRKVDAAELAARHEALLDILVGKGIVTREEYDRRLAEVRARIVGRRRPAVPSSPPAAPRAPRPGPGRNGPPNRPR